MLDLSMCGPIYEILDRAAAGRSVAVIHLQVGQLRQIVPDTLEYCWTLVCDQTELAGSGVDHEHEEKPLKYPVMFCFAVLVNKLGLLPHLDFELALFRRNLASVNRAATVLEVSARTAEGLDAWCRWLRQHGRLAGLVAAGFDAAVFDAESVDQSHAL